jgi:hypothetical protein
VLAAVTASFACSLAAAKLPFISDLSQGNRTIILTVLISGIFAALFPRTDQDRAEQEGGDADE